jgi:hemerythrin superfamily protein
MTSTDPDVIDVLTADHREVEDLTDQVTRAADPEQRRDLTDQLIAELMRHSVAEEMYVYPAMRTDKGVVHLTLDTGWQS